MQTTSVTSKERITIPKSIRQVVGIQPADKVEFVRAGNRLEMRVCSRRTRRSLTSHLQTRASRAVAEPNRRQIDVRPAAGLSRLTTQQNIQRNRLICNQ